MSNYRKSIRRNFLVQRTRQTQSSLVKLWTTDGWIENPSSIINWQWYILVSSRCYWNRGIKRIFNSSDSRKSVFIIVMKYWIWFESCRNDFFDENHVCFTVCGGKTNSDVDLWSKWNAGTEIYVVLWRGLMMKLKEFIWRIGINGFFSLILFIRMEYRNLLCEKID